MNAKSKNNDATTNSTHKVEVQRLMFVPYQYWSHLLPSYIRQTILKTSCCIGIKLLKYIDIIDMWIKYHIDRRTPYRPNTMYNLGVYQTVYQNFSKAAQAVLSIAQPIACTQLESWGVLKVPTNL